MPLEGDARTDPTHTDASQSQACGLVDTCDQHPTVPAEAAQHDHEDSDIYRGDPPPLPRSPSPDSGASVASSGSFLSRGRLGAIALVVELAITRWARKSSSSSSSSSSRSSINTSSQSHIARRRKQRPSPTNLQRAPSERDIVARIKARAESRRIPREFTLYVPPTPMDLHPLTKPDDPRAHSQRISRTSSLSLILGQLTTALKTPARARRHQDRISAEKLARTPHGSPILHHSYILPDHMKVPSRAASFTELSEPPRGKKGKERQSSGQLQTSVANRAVSSEDGGSHRQPKAWWLDVASPSWEDMRAIGKLLHLHPLTLEDILQQDPREKLELFPRLGYYFIVFRAIESQTTREKFWRHNSGRVNENHIYGHEGIVGDANIYLVVFQGGICSFHFADISEHTDRVRNRVLLFEESISMSSDWIAHGLIDSVVDAFFPFLEEVEKEVVDIEDIVYSGGEPARLPVGKKAELAFSDVTLTAVPAEADEKPQGVEKFESTVEEKLRTPTETTFAIRPTISVFFSRLSGVLRGSRTAPSRTTVETKPPTSTSSTLHRMARTRRLVTSLTRLLATKSEVVMQIRKRLMSGSHPGLGNGSEKSDDGEVAMYMGDVQDHIITLQHSLAHYERMLSQSHPSYLSQLNTIAAKTKSGIDKGVMLLTTVSISVLCIQTLIGTFSMNVRVPSNRHDHSYPYNVFLIVLSVAILILCIYLSVVRRWWRLSKRRREGML